MPSSKSYFLLILIHIYCFTLKVQSDNFTIGYLYSDSSLEITKNKQGRIISGAISYAVELINNLQPNLLSGHKLILRTADTYADTLVGTRELTSLWRDGAVAFFGPEDSCDVEAKVAAAWNLSMIAYVSRTISILILNGLFQLITVTCQLHIKLLINLEIYIAVIKLS